MLDPDQKGWIEKMNVSAETVVITGAFSYTGKHTTRLLLRRGYKVRTLTSHPSRENEFGQRVEVFPYNFHRPEELVRSLRAASTLINTYWVRFPRGESTFDGAVRNTTTLIDAARRAGVKRIVHVSIANPSLRSSLGYYRGKAQLEQAVAASGLTYTIVRPTVIFGLEDILINNIAWFARKFPVFGIPGDGCYRIRPIYVEDMARLLVDSVVRPSNQVINAVGPETFSFEELVRAIAGYVGRSPLLIDLAAPLAYAVTRLIGWFVGDTVLTWQEYQGLMADLLAPGGPSTGETRLSDWLSENRDVIGRAYASEVARHYAGLATSSKFRGVRQARATSEPSRTRS
jgi:uncharacterized protein YbjT (DUF2867 family)